MEKKMPAGKKNGKKLEKYLQEPKQSSIFVPDKTANNQSNVRTSSTYFRSSHARKPPPELRSVKVFVYIPPPQFLKLNELHVFGLPKILGKPALFVGKHSLRREALCLFLSRFSSQQKSFRLRRPAARLFLPVVFPRREALPETSATFTRVMGAFARAMGALARAMGALARAMGAFARAMGALARAMGAAARAMGALARAMGTLARAMGALARAMGNGGRALGDGSGGRWERGGSGSFIINYIERCMILSLTN
jgi:hypothetical protein